MVISPLYNRAIEYPGASPLNGQPIPAISDFLVHNMWLTWVIPLVWTLFTLAIILKKKTGSESQILHTAATMFIGTLMFVSFALAGIIPFIEIVSCLGK